MFFFGPCIRVGSSLRFLHSVWFHSCVSPYKRVFVEILFVVCRPAVFVETLHAVHSLLTACQQRSTAHFITTHQHKTTPAQDHTSTRQHTTTHDTTRHDSANTAFLTRCQGSSTPSFRLFGPVCWVRWTRARWTRALLGQVCGGVCGGWMCRGVG